MHDDLTLQMLKNVQHGTTEQNFSPIYKLYNGTKLFSIYKLHTCVLRSFLGDRLTAIDILTFCIQAFSHLVLLTYIM